MDVKIKNSSPKIFIFGFFSVYLQCWNEATQPTTTSLTTKQKRNEEESYRAGLNIKKHLGDTEGRKHGQTGSAVSASDLYEVFAGSNPAYSTMAVTEFNCEATKLCRIMYSCPPMIGLAWALKKLLTMRLCTYVHAWECPTRQPYIWEIPKKRAQAWTNGECGKHV